MRDISHLQIELGTIIGDGKAPTIVLKHLSDLRKQVDLLIALYCDISKRRNAADKTILNEDTYSLYAPITIDLPSIGRNPVVRKHVEGLNFYRTYLQLAIAAKGQKQVGVNTQKGRLYFYNAPILPQNAVIHCA